MEFRTRNRLVKDLSQQVLCTRLVVLVLIWATIVHSAGSASCSCYSYHRDTKQWSTSRDFCKERSGDLVSMETQDEWNFTKTQIQSRYTDKPADSDEWWIGLMYSQGQWKWLSNHSLTYNKWQPRKPSFITSKKHYVIVAKNYPKSTYGLFNNEKSDLLRGWICEYGVDKKDCSIQDRWCPLTTTSSSTTKLTTSTSTTTTIHSNDHQETTSTTSDGLPAGSPSPIPRTTDKKPFPVYVIIIVLVILLLICVVLAVIIYRWKRKRDLKPRNSHLSKNARVPVKLEHNNSTNNLNDKIIYADVINMEGGKVQIKCDSQSKNAAKPGEVIPYNSKDVVIRNADRNQKNINQAEKLEKTREAAIKRIDSEKVHLIRDLDGGPDEQEDDPTMCLYENVHQPNDSSRIKPVLQENDDANQEEKLLYVQIADIKESDPSCPVKMPSPYCETDYAVIVTSPKNA